MCCAVTRTGARFLLAAAFAMVVEISCTRASHDELTKEPSPRLRQDLAFFATKHAVVRIHMRDRTVVVTSRYALTDSFVVIDEILRGDKYYPTEPHLHSSPPPEKQPPADTILPLEIPIGQVAWVERWVDAHATSKGIVAGMVVFVAVIGGAILWLGWSISKTHWAD